MPLTEEVKRTAAPGVLDQGIIMKSTQLLSIVLFGVLALIGKVGRRNLFLSDIILTWKMKRRPLRCRKSHTSNHTLTASRVRRTDGSLERRKQTASVSSLNTTFVSSGSLGSTWPLCRSHARIAASPLRLSTGDFGLLPLVLICCSDYLVNVRFYTALGREIHSKKWIIKALRNGAISRKNAHDVYCSQCGHITDFRDPTGDEGSAPHIHQATVSPSGILAVVQGPVPCLCG